MSPLSQTFPVSEILQNKKIRILATDTYFALSWDLAPMQGDIHTPEYVIDSASAAILLGYTLDFDKEKKCFRFIPPTTHQMVYA